MEVSTLKNYSTRIILWVYTVAHDCFAQWAWSGPWPLKASNIIVLLGPFWVEDFLYIVFCSSFSSTQNGTGLVPLEPKRPKWKKNITVVTHRTVTGPKVLKNWYGKSGLWPLISIKNAHRVRPHKLYSMDDEMTKKKKKKKKILPFCPF